MALEIERKYLHVDLDAVADKLKALGASGHGRHFETNVVFDSPDGALLAANRLLRLRRQEWQNHTRCLLTFKLPVAGEAVDAKIRDELETEIYDFDIMSQILSTLGYEPVKDYEKIRESWSLTLASGAGGFNVKIDLDSLPFGDVVEIEGDPVAMTLVEPLLGLDKSQISLKSYYELRQEWRLAAGLESNAGFRFSAAEKDLARTRLGFYAG